MVAGFLFCGMFGIKRFTFTKTPAQVNLENVVSISELKNFCRIDHTADDTLLSTLRAAAVGYVEEYTNTLVGTYSCVGYSDRWQPLLFGVGPLPTTQTISVSYLANNGGDYQSLDSSKYFTDFVSMPARIGFDETPMLADDELNAVKIQFVAGHPDNAVPDAMVHAIQMLVAGMYEQRSPEIVGTISTQSQFGVRALLAPHRIIFAQ